jgi:hypothetical protein
MLPAAISVGARVTAPIVSGRLFRRHPVEVTGTVRHVHPHALTLRTSGGDVTVRYQDARRSR